jgi:hypothetical protein
VLKYEWGSGSAEPGAQPCWGWVREGGEPEKYSELQMLVSEF